MSQPPPAPPGPPHTAHGRRRLVREPDDRKIAGVCGGLADHLGVDVTVLRVTAAVLALVTPVVLIGYLVASLALPERRPDEPRVPSPRVHLGGIPHPLLIIGALVAVAAVIDDAWWLNPFPAAVALVGLGVWLIAQGWTDEDDTSGWHRPWPAAPRSPGDAGPGAPGPEDAPTGGGAPGPEDAVTDPPAPTTITHPLAASPWVVSVSQHSDADGDATTTLPSSPTAADATDSPAPTGDAGPPAGAVPPPVSPWWSGAPAEGAAAPPAREPSPRPGRASRLGTTVVAVLLAVGGGLWLVDSLEALEVPWEGALAVGLVACGVGLIVASWRGRAYALVPASFLLALALAAGELVDVPVGAGMGERVDVVDTTRELGHHHELFLGELSVDLSEAPLPETGTTTVEASVGMGELRVVVPRDAAVEVQARVGAGEIASPGGPDANEGGVGLDESFTLPGGRDGPRLQLELSMGAGSVEVIRD